MKEIEPSNLRIKALNNRDLVVYEKNDPRRWLFRLYLPKNVYRAGWCKVIYRGDTETITPIITGILVD